MHGSMRARGSDSPGLLDPDALFPVWRYHPFFTDTEETTADADITHRRHAIIETVFADLIDGPLAHMPSGRFSANSAWILCAAIAHNLLRCGRRAGRWYPRSSPRGHPAATHRHHPRPPGSTPTQTRPASTAPLALVPSLACPVAQHDRIQPTGDRNHLTKPPQGPTREHTGKAGQTSNSPLPTTRNDRDHTHSPTRKPLVHGSRLLNRRASPISAHMIAAHNQPMPKWACRARHPAWRRAKFTNCVRSGSISTLSSSICRTAVSTYWRPSARQLATGQRRAA